MARNLEAYSFEKGEVTDYPPETQPKGSYIKAVNWIRENTGQLQAEKGTTKIFDFPEDLEPIGFFNLNGELILLSTNESETISEIGTLNPDNSYDVFISNRISSNAFLLLSSNLLSFSFSSPIDIEARKLFNGNRVIYLSDGVNNNRRINLDSLPDEIRFEEEISLQFDFLIPRASLLSIDSEGSLPTGIYQLGIRYLTSGGNSTPAGIFTNPISIVDESQTSGRNQVDGAIPQDNSNKSITISLENLDSNFPFIEIIAITYIGISNTPQYNIIGRLENIENLSEFTYRDINQQTLIITEEEIITQPIVYGPAKHIEQKDGILFLSNLASDLTDINLQELANKVKLKYFIEEVEYDENINVEVDGIIWEGTTLQESNTGYNNQQTILDQGTNINSFKDYKSEFVASTKVSYLRGENYSFGLVPRTKKGTRGFAYHIPGSSTINTDANTTTKELGTYISSEQYPSNRGYPVGNVRFHKMPNNSQEPIFRKEGNQVILRLLGIKIIIPELSEQEKILLQGIDIVRQRRNTVQNRSIISQGIAKHNYQIDNTYISNVPSYGKCQAEGEGTLFDASSLDPNVFSFYSPDIIHGVINNFSGFDSIQRITRYSGIRKWDSRGTLRDLISANLITFNDIIQESSQPFIELLQDSKSIEAFTAKEDPITIVSNINEFLGFNLPFGDIPSYRMRANVSTLLLATKNSNQLPVLYTPEEKYFYRNASDPETYVIQSEIPTLELLALRNDISNQYGKVEEATYQLCASIIIGVDIQENGINQEFTFFGGDTFINKYALLINENSLTNKRTIETKSILYFFLESIGNYNYRHFVDSEIQGDSIIAGSLPYYPKYNILQSPESPIGLIDYTSNLDHSLGYNKQYSIENIIINYISRPLLFQQQDFFPNRTIRSEQTFEGEIADNYRIFLPNNFQDVPKDKGEITNTFVWNDQFMIHTERGLFSAYVNTREQIATDLSTIVLGNGGVFDRPPTELFDIDGGYLGTTSKWATVVTPFAYYFIVNARGKVFGLTDTIQEISDLGKFDFFRKNIQILQDSPLQNLGYVAGFDYLNSRLIITKLGDQGFTYSYFTKLQSWTGSHVYSPNWYIDRDKDFILYKDNSFFTLNTGEVAKYFNNNFSYLELEFSANIPAISKIYDNLYFGARIKNSITKRITPFEFFNKLKVYNLDQNSDELELIVSQEINPILNDNQKKISYKGKEYRISFPFDAVIDNFSDIFDNNNLDISRLFKGRITGEYCVINLRKDNITQSSELLIDYIKLLYRDHRI